MNFNYITKLANDFEKILQQYLDQSKEEKSSDKKKHLEDLLQKFQDMLKELEIKNTEE
jgi:ElaB/YqjD/DUF883 family membrane-anchored ribosome-binding protein